MSGFDRVAKPYRWMEYITFGRALERCRFRYLGEFCDARRVLVLGDGDGRFAAQLLRRSPYMAVFAVDGSEAMLAETRARCAAASDRLTTTHGDLAQGLPSAMLREQFDAVVTHFFLDCLSTTQTERLIDDVRRTLRPRAVWIVSEFAIPNGFMRWPSAAIVRGLYMSFRLLTGLRAQSLPDYRRALVERGFNLERASRSLGGLLVAEVWRYNGNNGIEA